MKVISKKVVSLTNEVPVFDLTIPKYHNFALANGVIVHNSAKRARDSSFQEVLPLKGKIKNPFKQAATDSEELLSLLMAIGYDPAKDNPLEELRVGKVILLTDGDIDGPLRGNTRVMTLNGENPTIKELANRWKDNPTPFWVWARDCENNLVPALAENPKKYVTTDEYCRLHLSDDVVIDCTPEHKWKLKDPSEDDNRIVWDVNGHGYIRTHDLRKGDRLDFAYLESRSSSEIISSYKQQTGNHRVVKVETINASKPKDFYCLTVPEHGNFLVDDGSGLGGVVSSNCHIQTLILGALLAYVPELFEQGRVYSCLPYEYMVKYKDRWYFDLTMEGLKSQVPASMHGSITHIKGWGELDADVLSDMAFNTEKRRLYKIEPENLKKTITRVRELMESEGSVERKKLLGIV